MKTGVAVMMVQAVAILPPKESIKLNLSAPDLCPSTEGFEEGTVEQFEFCLVSHDLIGLS